MTSTADDLVKKAVELREAGRIDEAVIAARRATAIDPDDANTWWQLGLAIFEKDGAAAATGHFKKTVELEEGFAYGWHRLGAAYKKTGMLDEAIASWEAAIEIDDDRLDTLKALADAYNQREFGSDEAKLFAVLQQLDSKGSLDGSYANTLGIGYHKKKDYLKAAQYFRRYAVANKSPIGYFNLGLALSSKEVGQDLDAVDSFRKSLEFDPGSEDTKNKLKTVSDRLVDLRDRIHRDGSPLLQSDQHYANYINPFELLNLTDVDDVFDMDVRAIQKAKKVLLQEIDLEEGKVDWVEGLHIDKSMAIKVVDGMTDNDERYWHHLVYQNKPLLNFLSRGALDHFLIEDDESALTFISSMDSFPGEFEALIGESFASQYDLVLTKAFENQNLDAIRALLSGRRWVSSGQDEKCFAGAFRQLNRLLEPLRQAGSNSIKIKPSLDGVRATLAKGYLSKTVALLPVRFQSVQQEAAGIVRSIAIDVNNHHDDAALGKEIIVLGKALAGNSSSVLLKMEEDIRIFDENIELESTKKEGKRIDQLLDPLRKAAENSEKLKPRLQSLRELLAYGNLSAILMALPSSLKHFQDDAASLLRGISIDAYNHHGDADLARDILHLAKSILSNGSAYLARVNEDLKTLDDRIKKESKDEAFLTYQGASYSITRKMVSFGTKRLAVEDVRRIRWGTSITRSGSVTTHAFTFVVGGLGTGDLSLSWTANKDVETQRGYFTKFMEAGFSYLMPHVIASITSDLDSNQTIRIGGAPVSRSGILFTIDGWFSNKQELCPWHRLRSAIDNGDLVITDTSNSKCKISMPLATVDNAIALHLMIKNKS